MLVCLLRETWKCDTSGSFCETKVKSLAIAVRGTSFVPDSEFCLLTWAVEEHLRRNTGEAATVFELGVCEWLRSPLIIDGEWLDGRCVSRWSVVMIITSRHINYSQLARVFIISRRVIAHYQSVRTDAWPARPLACPHQSNPEIFNL